MGDVEVKLPVSTDDIVALEEAQKAIEGKKGMETTHRSLKELTDKVQAAFSEALQG